MHIHNNSNLSSDREADNLEEGCVAGTHLPVATNAILLGNEMPRKPAKWLWIDN